jgi:hypothetical protein
MSSPLDDLLAAEIGQAELHSSGHFSLAREKALEKLAAFQLPDTASWVSKIIQASVASGSLELDIRQLSSSTEFSWISPPAWGLESVERAFYNPETDHEPGLQHFKQALWSVAVHGKRPFLLQLAGWSQALLWDGRSLQRKESLNSPTLVVSHRSSEAGKGIPLWHKIKMSGHNADILGEVRRRAFACPIPLRLDGRRMDTLQSCPGHGLSPTSYPLALGFFDGDLPTLRLPPGTTQQFETHGDTHRELTRRSRALENFPETFQLAAFLCAHVKRVPQGKSYVWRVAEQRCHIYWILDGIMIDQRAFDIPPMTCSLGLVCSAQGLTTDLSGLGLQVNVEYRERLLLVSQLVDDFLAKTEINFEEWIAEAVKGATLVGGLMVVGGLGLCFLSPFHGVAIAGMGAAAVFGAASEEKSIAGEFAKDLELLRSQWKSSRGNDAP